MNPKCAALSGRLWALRFWLWVGPALNKIEKKKQKQILVVFKVIFPRKGSEATQAFFFFLILYFFPRCSSINVLKEFSEKTVTHLFLCCYSLLWFHLEFCFLFLNKQRNKQKTGQLLILWAVAPCLFFFSPQHHLFPVTFLIDTKLQSYSPTNSASLNNFVHLSMNYIFFYHGSDLCSRTAELTPIFLPIVPQGQLPIFLASLFYFYPFIPFRLDYLRHKFQK